MRRLVKVAAVSALAVVGLSACVGGSVGGTVSGLVGSGLVLQINGGDDLAISANGSFTFDTKLASGSSYAVTVKTQPTSPSQTCTVDNGSGTVGFKAITNVSVTCRTLVGKFLYVPNTGSNDVSAYSIDATTGALTTVSGAPFAAGNSPLEVTRDPSGRFLYVVNKGAATDPSISEYTIDSSSGALTRVAGSPLALDPSGTYQLSLLSLISFAPSGKFAYLSGSGPGGLVEFELALDTASGSLTAIPGSPVLVTSAPSTVPPGTFDATGTHFYQPFGYTEGSIAIYDADSASGVLTPGSTASVPNGGDNPFIATKHPSGKYLYVPNLASGTIATYAIDANTGYLTAVAGSPFSTGGTFPVYAVTHPSGKFVFVANGNSLPGTGAIATLAAFAVDTTTGTLSAINGSPFSTHGTNALLDPSVCHIDVLGKFIYVNNSASNTIAGFSIDQTTGALADIPGSPFATGAMPSVPILDPSGQYLYVVNRGANSISSYAIDSTSGALTLVNTVPTGTSPGTVELGVVGLQ